MSEYQGPERRTFVPLSEDQLESIAERAAEKALEKVYAQVGQGIVHKLAWVIGGLVVAFLMWAGGKGITLK